MAHMPFAKACEELRACGYLSFNALLKHRKARCKVNDLRRWIRHNIMENAPEEELQALKEDLQKAIEDWSFSRQELKNLRHAQDECFCMLGSDNYGPKPFDWEKQVVEALMEASGR